MAKSRAPTKYTIVGETSDGVKVIKPKMVSGRLRELRAIVAQMRSVDHPGATAVPKPRKTTAK